MNKHLLLILVGFVLIGCASSSNYKTVEVYESKIKGYEYFKDELLEFTSGILCRGNRCDIGIGYTAPVLNLEVVEKFRSCYKKEIPFPIYSIIDTSTHNNGCGGIAFTDVGIFINNDLLFSSYWTTYTGKFFISYDELFHSSTKFKTIKENEFVIEASNTQASIWHPDYEKHDIKDLVELFEFARQHHWFNPIDFQPPIRVDDFEVPEALFASISKGKSEYISVYPNIKKSVQANFKKCNDINESTKLLAYIDISLFRNNGCNGIGFTANGFYVHNFWTDDGAGKYFFSYQDYLNLGTWYQETFNKSMISCSRLGDCQIAPNLKVQTGFASTFIFEILSGEISYSEEQIIAKLTPYVSNQTNLEAAEELFSIAFPIFLIYNSFKTCDLPNKPSAPSSAAPKRVKNSYNTRAKKYNKALSHCKKSKSISNALLFVID